MRCELVLTANGAGTPVTVAVVADTQWVDPEAVSALSRAVYRVVAQRP